MKIKKVYLFYILIVLISIFNYSNVVFGQSLKAKTASESVDVKKGEEIIVTLSLNDFENIDGGINAYKATLKYDENVFEAVQTQDFTSTNGWEQLLYNADTGEFVAINKKSTTNAGEVVQVKLTAKQDVTPGNTSVSFTDIVASQGKSDISPVNEDLSYQINIIQEQNTLPNPTEQSLTDNNTQQSNVKTSTIPNTGINERYLYYIIIAEVILLLLVIFLISKKKISVKLKDKQKIIMSIFAVGLVSLQIGGIVYANSKKGDIDQNFSVDYKDVMILQQHLINYKLIDDKIQNVADMNSDGKITVTDLALLVQKIENNLNYTVDIESGMDKLYFEKNEEIQLKFSALVSYDAEISQVTVNDKIYSVEKEESTGKYIVNLSALQNSGVYTYNITQVKLDNGKTIKTDFAQKIEVLKDQPTIEQYITEDLINESKIKVSYNLNDNDQSLESAYMVLYDQNNDEVEEYTVKSGLNEFEISVEQEKSYKLLVNVTYNRDSDALGEYDEDNTVNYSNEYDLKLVVNYDFSYSNIKSYDSNYQETSIYEKNQDIIIGFDSNNATIFDPNQVKINDKYYTVEQLDGKYYINIGGLNEIGNTQIQIQQIILSNGKVFDINSNNIISITIQKQKPTVNDVIFEENAQNNTINLSFNVIDEDNTVTSLKYIIKDASSNIIQEKTVNTDSVEEIISVEDTLTTSYNLQIVADYALSDNNIQLNQQLHIQDIDAVTKVNILNTQLSKTIFEKEEVLDVTYSIVSNKQDKITKLIVDNKEIPVNNLGDNQYSVQLRVGNTSGKKEIILSKVIFEDDEEIYVNESSEIEVLKSHLSAKNYNIQYDNNKMSVTVGFEIIDTDKAFLFGEVELIKNSDNTVFDTHQINNIGYNEFEIPVKELEDYTLKATVTYNRDIAGSILQESVILEKPVQMVIDYNITVDNIQTFTQDNINEIYFDKNEDINVRFTSTNSTKFIPETVLINDVEYTLSVIAENLYEATVEGFDTSGVKDINIQKILLNNGKELEITNNNLTKIEVLKQAPEIESFEYAHNDDKLNITLNLKDADNAFISGKVSVLDKNGEIFTQAITAGNNEFDVTLTLSEDFVVKTYVNYDLDTDTLTQNENEYNNVELSSNDIVVSQELIEFKDIKSVELYTKNSQTNAVEQVTQIDIAQFNPQDYIVKLNMEDLPSIYTEIKESKVTQDGEFRLVLKYDNAVQYEDGISRNDIEVKFGEINEGIATNITFSELIQKMIENPNATIKLTNDLDASSFIPTTATYVTNFTGTIDGNGYTIKNLSKPFIGTLTGGSIKNLIIEDASITSGQGILVNTANDSIITNVHILNSKISVSHQNGTGALAGKAENNTIISNCSANGLYVKGNKRVGGFVGIFNGSTIENCYIKGTVEATYDASGGMVGQVSNSSVKNSYVDIKFNSSVTWASGGLVGYADGSGVTLQNNITIAYGEKGAKTTDTTVASSSANNYEIADSNLKQSNKKGISLIPVSKITQEFLTETMRWNEDIWDLNGKDAENMPTLKNSDPMYSENITESATTQNPDLYIPELKRLQSYENYNSANEIAYSNVYKLIPFYDAKFIIEYGNMVSRVDLFNTQKISMILPYNQQGNLVTGLNTDNYNTISKIRIVFENNKTSDYNVSFKKKLNQISIYTISDLGISYTYNQYILNKNISIVNEVVEEVVSMDYSTQIASVTSETESRLYVDYYNESVKGKVDEVLLNILSNMPEYNIYLENDILTTKIRQDLSQNSQLKKLIYTYNYFEKWYGIDMGGVKLSDVIFLSVRNVNPTININTLVDVIMSLNRNTNNVQNLYTNGLQSKLGNVDLGQMIEHYVGILTDYESTNDWFTDTFDGELREMPIDVGAKYRAWDLLKKRSNLILAILTAPQEDMYLISMPSQLIIGSMNKYQVYVNGNTEQMKQKIDEYAIMLQNFYNTSANFIENSATRLNSRVHVQYDSRFGFPQGAPTPGDQNSGTTQDPVIKWVYEAIGSMAANNGTGAYANGTDVYWVVYNTLGGEFSFSIFSHETSHNQDGYYFYEGYGRRQQTWAEDHADSNIEQNISDGSVVFNIRGDLAPTSDVTNNLTMDRIDSPEKIYDYYKEMFETFYVLDYLTGQAFLQLTPEQQSQVAVKVYYDGKDNPDYEVGGTTTNYKKITADEFAAMNLVDMEDLWDNGIALTNARTASGAAPGAYGGDSHYSIYWYQPHNNTGRPDSHTFKRLGFEMLGVAGYSNGYVTYRSTKSTNDLDALRKITNDSDNTWKNYKLTRYETVEQNLQNIEYFDYNQVIEAFKKALETDAKNGNRNNTNNLRRVLYGVVKRATKDFTTGGIYSQEEVIQISSAQELISVINSNSWGNYELIADLDFTNIQSKGTSYINKEFVGKIEGNGHKITGLTSALFTKMTYAEIKNLVIENPTYTGSINGFISNSSKNSLVYDVSVVNSNANLPFGGTVEGSLQLIGDCSVTVIDNEISSIDDIIAIINSTDPLVKKSEYILTDDIDVSQFNSGNAIITGIFEGVLDGNGHTISNLKIPLFETLSGTVTNLTLENMEYNNASVSNVAVLAKYGNGATVDNINLNNITISARENIAGIFATCSNCTISRVTGSNITITVNRYYAGSIVGRITGNTTIKNCIMNGQINLSATHNGGIVGAINAKATIENIYANVQMNRQGNTDSRNKNGGLFGAIENNNTISIKNCVVVADIYHDMYKIASGKTDTDIGYISKYVNNVYELDGTTGISNIYEDSENVKSVSQEILNTSEFYIDTLTWSEEIWDLSKVSSGGLPSLK